ncbi:MAG: FadR family transcriptional regulator [Desulfomonile tiedjei]|nr:FadR family transcriptional regulator [Desulfomonile tiedjei]
MTPKLDEASRTDFRPIKMERVAEKIAAQLKKAITSGRFRVGDRLPPERDLAEQMGVSRPSVREAIQQLELLGLLESVHGGGTVVRSLTEQELQTPMEILLAEDKEKVVELTEVRGVMESWAARQAARNRTEEELARIHGYLEEMEHDLEKGRIRAEVDVKFHTEVVAASHNTIFLHMMQSIYNLVIYSITLYREQVFLTREDQETIFHHHLAVFKAIQNRDPDSAEAAMSAHLRFVLEEYKSRFLPRSD